MGSLVLKNTNRSTSSSSQYEEDVSWRVMSSPGSSIDDVEGDREVSYDDHAFTEAPVVVAQVPHLGWVSLNSPIESSPIPQHSERKGNLTADLYTCTKQFANRHNISF